MATVASEIALELAEMLKLRMVSKGVALKVGRYLETKQGQADVAEYRDNGMKISEITDHLIVLIG